MSRISEPYRGNGELVKTTRGFKIFVEPEAVAFYVADYHPEVLVLDRKYLMELISTSCEKKAGRSRWGLIREVVSCALFLLRLAFASTADGVNE